MSQATAPDRSRVIEVTAADMPLHCPWDNDPLWSSHPRVFLSVEDSADGATHCPYCGTVYRLKAD